MKRYEGKDVKEKCWLFVDVEDSSFNARQIRVWLKQHNGIAEKYHLALFRSVTLKISSFHSFSIILVISRRKSHSQWKYESSVLLTWAMINNMIYLWYYCQLDVYFTYYDWIIKEQLDNALFLTEEANKPTGVFVANRAITPRNCICNVQKRS